MDILFYILLLLIAFLYAAVGHGGASGYLALMAFYSIAPEVMRPTALLLNVFVSLIAFIQYYRNGYFRWNLFWPFAITSIPAAFLGGSISIEPMYYKKILALLLLFPILKLSGIRFESEHKIKELNIYIALLTGAIIGLLSGMIGIGGGIILSPLILLFHWADIKKTAAISALFIFVNSVAGIAGSFLQHFQFTGEMTTMLLVAITGAFAGSYLGAKKFENILLKRILAAVLLIASVKLIMT